jgi:signal peptidase I
MRLTPRTALALLALAGLARVFGSSRFFPVGRFEVEGRSMEPSYRAGDRVLVNRLAYRSRPPAPGDAVVLRDPERHGRYLLKRVARLPDAADSKQQTANGTGAGPAESGPQRAEGVAPADSKQQTANSKGGRPAESRDQTAGGARIWVLGDNGADSRDSRSFGAVPLSAIVGKAWMRY